MHNTELAKPSFHLSWEELSSFSAQAKNLRLPPNLSENLQIYIWKQNTSYYLHLCCFCSLSPPIHLSDLPLPSVLNTATRVIFRKSNSDHAISLLKFLKWLSIYLKIKGKDLTMANNIL